MISLLLLNPEFPDESKLEWSTWYDLHGGQVLYQSEEILAVEHQAPLPFFVWPLQQWQNCEKISFISIKDAQAKLRHWGRGGAVRKWLTASAVAHRRTQLILDGLPELKNDLQIYPPDETRASETVGGFCLLSESELLVSSVISPPVWGGQWKMSEDKTAPSRAYLKLWEFFSRVSPTDRPGPGDQCVDMGSAPGGWTWVLAQAGAKVISVDKADQDPRMAKFPTVEICRKDAFTLQPKDLPPMDWFFSDVICDPQRLVTMVNLWDNSGRVKNFVCTMKFKGKTDFKSLQALLQIPGSHAVHLFHNKHEITWYRLSR